MSSLTKLFPASTERQLKLMLDSAQLIHYSMKNIKLEAGMPKPINQMSNVMLTLPASCHSESCIKLKIKLKNYTSLWCLKWFYEGL